ncbi:cysteine hydrolase family protein [Streptomyces sp. NPDC059850]|uniref:cysteine hydrolase family protein n=1 Tax=Streptomyces sp. NPDC059850 TaxID=3346970 RepID=UPI00364EC2FB
MSDTALLVMDIQNGIVGRIAGPDYLPRLARAVEAARSAGIPVMHVVVGFRSGHPEVSGRNKTFGAFPEGAFTPGDPGAAIHPDVRQAADLDYQLTVLADGCADADEEVHRVLTEKVFPRQAEVTTIEKWAATLG